MPSVQQYFEKFLSNIEPSEEYKDDAKTAWNNLAKHLQSEECAFSKYIDSIHIYGSYKRKTAINSINDVDICVLLNIDPEDSENTPKKILARLKKHISKYYKDVKGYDEDNTEYNRKSIVIPNALPEKQTSVLTLDVIPAVLTSKNNIYLVTDRKKKEWVETNVRGHDDATTSMNKESDGKFVPFVKLFKFWKKQNHNSKHPKGFLLEAILLENNLFKYENGFAETFVSVLKKILEKFDGYEDFTEVPDISDPALPDETVKTRLTLPQFKDFMRLVKRHQKKSSKALESDDEESIKIWREIFGENFPEYTTNENFNSNSYADFFRPTRPTMQYCPL